MVNYYRYLIDMSEDDRFERGVRSIEIRSKNIAYLLYYIVIVLSGTFYYE